MLLDGFNFHQNCNSEYRRFKNFVIKYSEELLTEFSEGCMEMSDGKPAAQDQAQQSLHQLVQIAITGN